MRNKTANILFFIAVALIAIVFLHRHLPFQILLDLAILIACAVPPGVVLVNAISVRPRTQLELLSLGAAIGIVLVPGLFSLLATIGLHQAAAPTSIVVALILWAFVRNRRESDPSPQLPVVVWGALITILVFLEWFSFECLNFDSSGNLVTHALFGYDLPYLSSFVASLRDNGRLLDLHQLNIPYAYHDYSYRLLAAVGTLSHTDAFVLNSFVGPIFFYWCSLVALYCLAFTITKNTWVASIIALSQHFLGGLLGSEQGGMALSPSYAAGNILFYSSLLLLYNILRDHREWRSSDVLLLTIVLCGLVRTKLTTYFVVEAGLAIAMLILLLKKEGKVAFSLSIPFLISALVFVISSPASQLAPGSDFLFGAPLLGYANHVAAILHIPVSSINPVAHGVHFGLKQLLSIPYFIFHLLRFAAGDERYLIVIASLILFRKRIVHIYSSPDTPVFFWTLVFMMPIGFLLPILYSPAWYALALSFYGPLVSIEVARVLSMLCLQGIFHEQATRKRNIFLGFAAVLLLIGVVQNARTIRHISIDPPYVVTASRIEALHYLRDHSMPGEITASRRFNLHDTDESYYLYSAFAERPMVSEGATYGSLLGAVSGIDSVKGLGRVQAAEDTLKARRDALDSIYLSTSLTAVMTAIRKYDVRYIFEDKEIAQHLRIDPHSISELLFSNSSLDIWKVRP